MKGGCVSHILSHHATPLCHSMSSIACLFVAVWTEAQFTHTLDRCFSALTAMPTSSQQGGKIPLQLGDVDTGVDGRVFFPEGPRCGSGSIRYHIIILYGIFLLKSAVKYW